MRTRTTPRITTCPGRRPTRNGLLTSLPLSTLALFAVLVAIVVTAAAQPAPGDVFREYSWTTEKLHVLSLNEKPLDLPADVDLKDATRAEVALEMANEHMGFEGMTIRLNGNQWYSIRYPESSPKDPSPSLWFHHWYPTIAVALTDLKSGTGNSFEMKVPAACFDGKVHPNGNQPLVPWCPVYGGTLRVYYDAARKPHPTGHVLTPGAQSTIGLSAALKASAKSDTSEIQRIDFIGRYEDINYEGDGIYDQWHYHLFHGQITHHLGSTTQPDGKVVWDTSWVPDQPGPIEIAARITDRTGLICMTEAVGGLKLVRPGLSVELCKPFDVPRSFTGCQYGEWVIPGVRTEKFTIRGDLSRILDARYVIASWGGQKLCHGYRINGVRLEDKSAGDDWVYNLSTPPIRPLTALKAGENTFSTVVGPGRVPDIYLPGVQILIRYRTGEAATAPTSTLTSATSGGEPLRTEKLKPLPHLRVSDNHRFLVTADGKPFFWLGDTAWELFHRLNREETERYLADRAAKGFNVIQAVALAELDGLTVPNPQGHLPLIDKDLSRPDVKEGPDNDYWDDVEWTLRAAERKGLYVGLLPMWGKYCPADTNNCERYGRFIGGRFKDRANIIWILGGDRPSPTKPEQDAWRAMACGIAIGVSGREDYDRVLMTYHTFGPDTSSKYFHEDSWLDFNGIQSSHGNAILNWKMIEHDYQLKPAKPVIDLETSYPGIGLNKMAPGNEDDARRSAYWAVFSGAFGHTSGNNSIWQMYAPGRKPLFGVKTFWSDTLDAPSAVQMGYLRKLIESRPFLTQEPDQSLLVNGPGDDLEHLAALRGDGCALIYTPTGKPFRVNLGKLTGKQVKAWWFDPRTGKVTAAGQYARDGERDFTPPGVPGVGNDWVLALDDPQRGFGPPRVALEPYDWRGFGGFDTFKWRGFLLANNRWGGGNGRIWFKEGEGNWSFWTEHSDDLDQGQVKSFPHAGIGWMWGNWAPNQALPIQLGELAVAKSDWTVTLPESEPNQSYVVYYQIYTSAVPDPKNDGNKISGDLAVIIHRKDFPFEAWSKKLGEFDIGGRKWRVVQKASAIGKSTYIIMIPTAPLAKRERGRLIVENFDLKPCIDFCVAQGFYQPTDYLLTIQAGWESRGLHGCLRSDDLKLAVGRKGAEPIRLPLAPLAK